MSEISSLVYQDIPNNRLQGKTLTNVSPLDWWITGVSLLITILTGVWLYQVYDSSGWPMIAVLSELLMFCILMYRMREGYGRLYDEIYRGVRMAIKMAIVKNVLWRANDRSSWFVRWVRNRNGKHSALPFKFVVIKATDKEGNVRRVALTREQEESSRPYDRVYIGIRGGAFASKDPNGQMELVNEFTEVANQAVALADLKLGISYLGIFSPPDQMKIPSYFTSNGNPLIFRPEVFDTTGLDENTLKWAARARESANQLRPMVEALGGGRRFSIFEIVVKRDRKQWRSAERGKQSDQDLLDLPIVELAENTAAALRSDPRFGFDEVKVLGLADLAEMVRCSWDVVNIQSYYLDRALGKVPTTDEQIEEYVAEHGTEGLDEYLACWPRDSVEIGPKGQWLRIDDTFFASLRISQLPRNRARADQFIGLNSIGGAGVWTRYATVGQSVSGDTETRNLVYQTALTESLRRAFSDGQIVDDPRKRRRRSNLMNQTEQISTHSIAQNFNIVFTVAADSASTALKQRRNIKASLRRKGFIAVEIDEPSRVLSGVVSGAFGISRL
jgi:hypothetical protein